MIGIKSLANTFSNMSGSRFMIIRCSFLWPLSPMWWCSISWHTKPCIFCKVYGVHIYACIHCVHIAVCTLLWFSDTRRGY